MAMNRYWVWLKVARKDAVNDTCSGKRMYGRNGAGIATYTGGFSPTGRPPALYLACGIDLDEDGMAEFEADMGAPGQSSDYEVFHTDTHPFFQDTVDEMNLVRLEEPERP